MERKQTKRYRLVDLHTGRVWDYEKATSVIDTMFALTMWPPHAAVFKDGVRYKRKFAGEAGELARTLARWQPR